MYLNDETNEAILKNELSPFLNDDLSLNDDILDVLLTFNNYEDYTKKLFDTWHEARDFLHEHLTMCDYSIVEADDILDFLIAYNLITIYNIGRGFVMRYNFLPVLQMHYIIKSREVKNG